MHFKNGGKRLHCSAGMTNEGTKPLLGAHVSGAGGLYRTIENATRLGATTIQFFGASPRQWYAPLPKAEDIEIYKKTRATSNVQKVFLHGAYLANLASSNHELRQKSIESLSSHLKIAHMVDAQGLIFHMGSVGGNNRQEGLQKTIEGMKIILENVPGTVELIMENSSGGGGKLCSDVDELAFIKQGVNSDRIKVCLDTQHAFASGVIEEYTPERIQNLLSKWEKVLGLSNISLFHVNDSKTKTNTQHDRHENLGEGFIGLDGFKHLAKEGTKKSLHHVSWILEVPGFSDEGPDERNMEILRGLFS